jgi:hypothetical protein
MSWLYPSRLNSSRRASLNLTRRLKKTKFKSEYTKNEYFQQMLQVAQQQVDYKYLLADSWYASKENMNYVLGLKHHFIFALESSCTVALTEKDRSQGKFQRVDALVFPDKTPLKVFLRSVKQELLLVRQVFTNVSIRQSSLACRLPEVVV